MDYFEFTERDWWETRDRIKASTKVAVASSVKNAFRQDVKMVVGSSA